MTRQQEADRRIGRAVGDWFTPAMLRTAFRYEGGAFYWKRQNTAGLGGFRRTGKRAGQMLHGTRYLNYMGRRITEARAAKMLGVA